MNVLAKNQNSEEVEMHLQMEQNSQSYYVKKNPYICHFCFVFDILISFGLISRQLRQGKSGVEIDTDC